MENPTEFFDSLVAHLDKTVRPLTTAGYSPNRSAFLREHRTIGFHTPDHQGSNAWICKAVNTYSTVVVVFADVSTQLRFSRENKTDVNFEEQSFTCSDFTGFIKAMKENARINFGLRNGTTVIVNKASEVFERIEKDDFYDLIECCGGIDLKIILVN